MIYVYIRSFPLGLHSSPTCMSTCSTVHDVILHKSVPYTEEV